jgi:hypothetical protein
VGGAAGISLGMGWLGIEAPWPVGGPGIPGEEPPGSEPPGNEPPGLPAEVPGVG